MTATKVTIVALALIAGIACVQAAGGIKGRQPNEESQQRIQAAKGLRPPAQQQQQQQYLPPPPPPQPIALLPPPPPPAPAQLPQQAIKAGPGQVTPVFSAIRVQPAPLPVAPLPPQAPIVQQQLQQEVQQQQQQEPEIVQQQQQQQAEEIDPNAAAQDAAPAVIAPARQGPAASNNAAAAAASEEEANPRPEPYSFQYAFDSGDSATSGSSAREEQQDASGRVTGFYTLRGEDGRDRRVDYIADASGFRAVVRSNEMGTADKDSADVDWQVSEPSEGQVRVAELATQAARQRALLNPQPQAQQSQQRQVFQTQQQQQQQPIASASSASQQKFSSPRQRGSTASASGQQISKINPQSQAQQTQQQQVQISQQLQEPFEQIRQTELNTRARKSRHAPFYLYTI